MPLSRVNRHELVTQVHEIIVKRVPVSIDISGPVQLFMLDGPLKLLMIMIVVSVRGIVPRVVLFLIYDLFGLLGLATSPIHQVVLFTIIVAVVIVILFLLLMLLSLLLVLLSLLLMLGLYRLIFFLFVSLFFSLHLLHSSFHVGYFSSFGHFPSLLGEYLRTSIEIFIIVIISIKLIIISIKVSRSLKIWLLLIIVIVRVISIRLGNVWLLYIAPGQ